MVRVDNILKNNKALLLAFDQGLEHGPRMFDMHTADPSTVLDIALEGELTGVIMHAGLAEKYHVREYKDIPLVVKLNGQSDLNHMNPMSSQICSVDRAVKLGADAVGYTIYDGSPAESAMFAEFGKIVEEAHDYGLPVIAWMYPRSEQAQEQDPDVIAYSARLGLELGADFVKVKYNNNPGHFSWVTKLAGRCGVLLSDPPPSNDFDLLNGVHEAVKAGARGVAFGRTIWQHPRPLKFTRALHGVIKGKTAQEVVKWLN